MGRKLICLLVVEDNDLDAENIERACRGLSLEYPMVRATDGQDALDKLRGTAEAAPLERPYVVLLDLNMPKMNGVEFLHQLRNDPKLKSTPVFVLTTSNRPRDIENAHKYNVSGYIVKPLAREQLLEALTTLDRFWQLCEHPSG